MSRLPRGVRRRTTAAALACAVLAIVAMACDRGSPLEPSLPPLAELPADLAAVTFAADGELSVAYVMLELRQPGGFAGFVAVDAAGRPVWFFRTAGNPLGFTRRANGNFVLLDTERGLVEVTPVRSFSQP